MIFCIVVSTSTVYDLIISNVCVFQYNPPADGPLFCHINQSTNLWAVSNKTHVQIWKMLHEINRY